MKATVDPEKCQGHARCAIYAEEVFQIDDQGHAFVAIDVIHAGLEEVVQRAAANCPESAITVTE